MKITLPLPPSANNLFKNVVVMRWSSKQRRQVPVVVRAPHGDYVAWKQTAWIYLKDYREPPEASRKGDKTKFRAKVRVGINYTGDIENRTKALFDFLASDEVRLTPDDRYLEGYTNDRDLTIKGFISRSRSPSSNALPLSERRQYNPPDLGLAGRLGRLDGTVAGDSGFTPSFSARPRSQPMGSARPSAIFWPMHLDIVAEAVPVDILDTVANGGLALADGKWLLQNTSDHEILFAPEDAAVADPSTLIRGHRLLPTNWIGLTAGGGKAFYVWGGYKASIFVSKEA